MKRTLTLILAFLMFASLVLGAVGCQKDDPTNNEDPNNGEDVTVEDPLFADLPQNNFLKDGVPVEIFILRGDDEWSSGQMVVEEVDFGLPVDSAIYTRNSYVEETLGVVLNETVEDVGNGKVANRIQTLHLSGLREFDICYDVARFQNAAVAMGVYLPISEYDMYINLEKPWWYEDDREAMTFYDKCYMLTGDLNLVRNEYMWALAFNRDTLVNYGVNSPYDYVASGEWTLEKMYEMCVNTWEEDSGKYAMTSHFRFSTALMVGADLDFVERTQDGGLQRANIDDNFLRVVEDLIEYFFENNGTGKMNGIKTEYSSNHAVGGGFAEGADYVHDQAFREGNATFLGNPLGKLAKDLPSSGVNYGIVPLPKYSEDQKLYRNCLYGSLFTLCVPTMVAEEEGRLECVGTVLEWLGAYSYDLLRPAYYEYVLYGRLLQEPDAVLSLDILLGYDERGEVVPELDSLFGFGMTDKLFVSLSDCKPAYNNAVRTIANLVDDKMASVLEYYKKQG